MSQDDAIGRLSGESVASAGAIIAKQNADAPGLPSLYRGVVIDVIHDLFNIVMKEIKRFLDFTFRLAATVFDFLSCEALSCEKSE